MVVVNIWREPSEEGVNKLKLSAKMFLFIKSKKSNKIKGVS